MRRAWNFLVDVVDGLLASLLYGGQGGLTHTTSDLELENQEKIRGWAAGETKPSQRAEETIADFEERARRYREGVNRPDDSA